MWIHLTNAYILYRTEVEIGIPFRPYKSVLCSVFYNMVKSKSIHLFFWYAHLSTFRTF